MADNFLLYFSLKYDGDFVKVVDAIKNKESYTLQEYNEVMKTRRYKNVNVLDEKYPIFLRVENCPPINLFYQGNLELLEEEGIPIRYSMLKESENRFLTTLCPDITENGEIVLDYIVMAESQKDLDTLLERLKESELPIKNYEKNRTREQER